jgi:hypothetical protein
VTGRSAVATWLAATLAIALASACSERPSPQVAALADVIRGAQTAELKLQTLPDGYNGPGSSSELMRPLLDDGQTELAKYYVGTLLTRKVAEYQRDVGAMFSAGGGGRVGGVKTLSLSNIQVNGTTAKVSAEVTVWFKTAQFWYQSPTTRMPETNIIDLELHLVKDGGSWKIDQEHQQYAPGGGP